MSDFEAEQHARPRRALRVMGPASGFVIDAVCNGDIRCPATVIAAALDAARPTLIEDAPPDLAGDRAGGFGVE